MWNRELALTVHNVRARQHPFRPAQLTGRAAALVHLGSWRRHRALLSLVAVGVLLRGLAWWTHGAALAFYGDSFAYLHDRNVLQPGAFHPLGYPLFLRAFRALGGLGVLTVGQHLLGLACAVAMYALLVRIGARPWLAAVGVAGLLLDAYQVDLEQFVMAETLTEALLVAAMLALLWRERPTVLCCAAAGGLVACATLTRTAALAVLPALVVIALGRRWGVAHLAALVSLAVIPLGGYATWYHARSGEFALEGTGGRLLYARVQPYVPCDRNSLPPVERPLCVPPVPLTGPTRDDPSAGGGPIYFAWNGNSPLNRVRPPAGQTRNQIAERYALRQIITHPVAYTASVGTSFLRLLAPTRDSRTGDWQSESWQFLPRTDPPRWHVLLLGNHQDSDTLRNVSTRPAQPARRPAGALSVYSHWGYVPGPLLATGLVLPIIAWRRSRRRGSRMRWAMVGFSLSGCLLLIVPVAASGVDFRYLLPALPLLPAAAVVATELLIRSTRSKQQRRDKPARSEHPTERPLAHTSIDS